MIAEGWLDVVVGNVEVDGEVDPETSLFGRVGWSETDGGAEPIFTGKRLELGSNEAKSSPTGVKVGSAVTSETIGGDNELKSFGGAVALRCVVSSVPSATVSFFLGDKLLSDNNVELSEVSMVSTND